MEASGPVTEAVSKSIARAISDGLVDEALDAGICVSAVEIARVIDAGIATREESRSLMAAFKTLRDTLSRLRLTPMDRTGGDGPIDFDDLAAQLSNAANGDSGTLGD